VVRPLLLLPQRQAVHADEDSLRLLALADHLELEAVLPLREPEDAKAGIGSGIVSVGPPLGGATRSKIRSAS
jgi:hypothetical protein